MVLADNRQVTGLNLTTSRDPLPVAKLEGISSLSRSRHRSAPPFEVELDVAALSPCFCEFIADELGNLEVVSLGKSEHCVGAQRDPELSGPRLVEELLIRRWANADLRSVSLAPTAHNVRHAATISATDNSNWDCVRCGVSLPVLIPEISLMLPIGPRSPRDRTRSPKKFHQCRLVCFWWGFVAQKV